MKFSSGTVLLVIGNLIQILEANASRVTDDGHLLKDEEPRLYSKYVD